MGGTETCRRPGLCLIGPLLGPSERVLSGAPFFGASLYCSTQCSCSRPKTSTEVRRVATRSQQQQPPPRPSSSNSVNRYFKADIRLAKGQPSEGATTKLGEGRAPAVFYHDMTSTRHGHRSRPSSSSLIRFNGSQFSPQKQESPVGPVCQTPFSHLSVLSAMSR